MKLKGKIAVVTGASTGIGRAIAVEFAKEGCTVLINARSVSGLEKTLALVRKAGGDGEIFTFDLRDFDEIQKFCIKVKEKYKKVDILVNVAGIYHDEKRRHYGINFEDYKIDEVLATYDVGITAPTLLSHQLILLMGSKSKIVNISGTFESGAKGWLPYYVSKKALEELTIGLSQELKDKDIQVNCISPSDTFTEAYRKFFPEYAKEESCVMPEDVGKLAIFFASSEANSITGEIRVIKKA